VSIRWSTALEIQDKKGTNHERNPYVCSYVRLTDIRRDVMNNYAASYTSEIRKAIKESCTVQKIVQGVEEKYRELCTRAPANTSRADSPDTDKRYDVPLQLMDL
jgi:hypothetical protein